ncbi:unnamed protein product [Chrysoparadoxa australica]
MIPSITNTFGIPMMLLPLMFVVTVDAVFLIIEDVARHKADKQANSSTTKVYDTETNRFESTMWSDVEVGDLIKIKNRDAIPADVVIMAVDEPNPESPAGVCYVETKSLDGETNLKFRQAVKGLVGQIRTTKDVAALSGKITMEHPNKLIDHFTGSIRTQLRSTKWTYFPTHSTHAPHIPFLLAYGASTSEPIEPDNLLLRGCVLRNSRWALGLVLNTGMDTKIMMSMSAAPTKHSHLSERINTEIKRVATVMLVFCLVGAVLGTSWVVEYAGSAWYMQGQIDANAVVSFLETFFYYILLMNSFIPISLYVSMNFVRFFQSWLMNQDIDMYHEDSDTCARVRTMNLNEDLGQVSHIFSDKTGTLTCNVMDFRKCSIGGVSYGQGMTEIGRAALTVAGKAVPAHVAEADIRARDHSCPHVNFYDPQIWRDISDGGEREQLTQEFFTALALCHTVIPETYGNGEVMLSASSPDDEALVLGAKYFGVEFVNRVDTTAVLLRSRMDRAPAARATSPVTSSPPSPENSIYQDAQGRMFERQEYEVLHIIGFDSDRKRMSTVCQRPDGSVVIYTKGADTVMLPLLKIEDDEGRRLRDKTIRDMDVYAAEGLRTLVIAKAELDRQWYEAWADEYELVSGDIKELEKKNQGLPNRIVEVQAKIERDLTLLGASAIEDKLQDGVPGAIAGLMAAGVKVWVLTGDKEETAINIGVACQLIWSEDEMDRLVINMKGPNSELTTGEIQRILEAKLEEALQGMSAENADPNAPTSLSVARCMVIDGLALLEAMRSVQCQKALLKYADVCHSVVGCRVTPDQKRAMVALVRENLPNSRTLSIGDGANDVPMIQGAHIGVGISGQEGMQAVNASDYSISQFRFLRKLMLVHGRWNYRRSSRVVCYLFYKSVIFAAPLFFYAFWNGFSGTLFYDFVTTNLYAVSFTALPILIYGIYDKDITAELCLRYPQLYLKGIEDTWLTVRVFWSWMFQALVEGCFFTVIPLYAMSGPARRGGQVDSLYEPGTATFSLVVLSVSLKMFWVQTRWHFFHVLVLFLSVLLFYVATLIVNWLLWLNYDLHGVMTELCNSGNYWMTVFLCLSVIFMRDLAWKFHHRWWYTELHQLVVEHEALGNGTYNLDQQLAQRLGQFNGHRKLSIAHDPDFSLDEGRQGDVEHGDIKLDLALTGATEASVGENFGPQLLSPLQHQQLQKRSSSNNLMDPRRRSQLLDARRPVFIGPHGTVEKGRRGSGQTLDVFRSAPSRPDRDVTMLYTGSCHSPLPRNDLLRGGSQPFMHNSNGFAFSCDDKAQATEIAMIMGWRTRAPIKRTASFFERRDSMRLARMQRRRELESGHHGSMDLNEISTHWDAESGVGSPLEDIMEQSPRMSSGRTSTNTGSQTGFFGTSNDLSLDGISIGAQSAEKERGRGREPNSRRISASGAAVFAVTNTSAATGRMMRHRGSLSDVGGLSSAQSRLLDDLLEKQDAGMGESAPQKKAVVDRASTLASTAAADGGGGSASAPNTTTNAAELGQQATRLVFPAPVESTKAAINGEGRARRHTHSPTAETAFGRRPKGDETEADLI